MTNHPRLNNWFEKDGTTGKNPTEKIQKWWTKKANLFIKKHKIPLSIAVLFGMTIGYYYFLQTRVPEQPKDDEPKTEDQPQVNPTTEILPKQPPINEPLYEEIQRLEPWQINQLLIRSRAKNRSKKEKFETLLKN